MRYGFCRNCVETKLVSIDNKCLTCDSSVDDETVVDWHETEYYRQTYEGAKRSGLIDAMKCEREGHDPDGSGMCIRCGME